jgi:hypothetical protein
MTQSLLLAFLRELVVEDLNIDLQKTTYTHKTTAKTQMTRKSQSTPIGLCTPLALITTNTQSSLKQW